MVKTAIAVFLCLLIYYIRGYEAGNMPTEAAITAIICVQPFVKDTGKFALERLTGSLIGSVWVVGSLILLLSLYVFACDFVLGRTMTWLVKLGE